MNKFKSYLLKNNLIILFTIIGLITVLSSCNAVKYVPDGKHLLIKNAIYVNDKKNIDDNVSAYLVQRPNQLVLGLPLPLHFHNIGNKDFENDFDQWKLDNPKGANTLISIFSEKQAKAYRNFKYNLHQWWLNNGESPVLLDLSKTKLSANSLLQHYVNEGYFKSSVTYNETLTEDKKASVDYFITTGKPFFIDSVSTNIASKSIDSVYKVHQNKSLIKTGKIFKTSYFEEEQDRLTNLFRNSGFYHFNKQRVSFTAFDNESTNLNHKSNVILNIEDRLIEMNDSIYSIPFKIQRIKKVTIYTDYSYNTKDEIKQDSAFYKEYLFLAKNKIKYNLKHLSNSIFIEPNTIYKDIDRELTWKYLRELQNFKLVDIKYKQIDDNSLEASIYLTPLKKYSIGFDTELTHSNIKQLGVSGKFSFLNRNTFKGAELFKLSLQGSFFNSSDSEDLTFFNAWEAGINSSLTFPKFILPFNTNKIVPKQMSPKTEIILGTSLQKNIGLDKQTFTGIIDFIWQSTKTKKHSFELFNAQYIKNLNSNSYFSIYDSEFKDLSEIATIYNNTDLQQNEAISFMNSSIEDDTFKNTNPAEYQSLQNIQKRYEIITDNVLVPAIAYTFTFNNSTNFKDNTFSSFRTHLLASGNFTSWLAKTNPETNKKELAGLPIAQYFRTDLEYKKFWGFSPENLLAFRSSIGFAIPYGNSENIPFSRSYFIGGPNDLRAWKIYELGPGTSQTGLEYNVGNLKFLTSLEYRFKIINSFKGALFVDAGNIWDISNSSITSEDSKFNGFESIKDIAIGSGLGLRYDFNFLVIRLDFGFKTYEPYNAKNEKWFQNYNFGNVVYNIGINYPF